MIMSANVKICIIKSLQFVVIFSSSLSSYCNFKIGFQSLQNLHQGIPLDLGFTHSQHSSNLFVFCRINIEPTHESSKKQTNENLKTLICLF